MSTLKPFIARCMHIAMLTLLVAALPATAQQSAADSESLGRAVGAELEAEVSAIDTTTREITLSSGMFSFTVYAPEGVVDLAAISVGDRVVGTYSAAVEVELRAPTEAELASPWEVLAEGAVTGDAGNRSVETARLVRAVVTVAALDKAKGLVVVTDSRGFMHFIGDVEPEKLADVAVAQQLVVVFTESMVVSIEKKA
ncbi:MAG: hypothetical protein KDI17_01010 [Halioglobus sp.]|nr:hypothetical protein [Halioglobus sp.]